VLSAPLVTDASYAPGAGGGAKQLSLRNTPRGRAVADEKVSKLKQITFQPPALTFSTLCKEQGSSVFYKLLLLYKKDGCLTRGQKITNWGKF
jgi:hypothetical protein